PSEHPDSPNAATIVAALRTCRALVLMPNYFDQPTELSRFNAEDFDTTQPLGLGPAMKVIGWLAVAPVAAVAVTSAVATGPFSSMLATLKVSGNWPLAAALA